jgi:hypothetical protein
MISSLQTSRLVCILEVLDDGRAMRRPEYGHKVESTRWIVWRMLYQKISRGALHVSPFAASNRFLKVLVVGAGTRSYLNEHDRVSFGTDKIDLPGGAAIVAGEDLVAASFQVACRGTFPPSG